MIKGLLTIVITLIVVGSVAVPIITSSTDEPEENDKLNVFVLAGQSNSAYYNADVEVANDNAPIKDGFAFYYGTSSQPISCGTIANMQYDTTFNSYDIFSMTDSEGLFRIGNIESPFASEFVNKTNQKCLIINTGIGGVSINSYIPGTVGYNYAKAVVENAISKIPDEFTPILRSVLWVQGESDASMQVPTYITQFEKMKDGFSDLGFDSVFISETRPINGGNSSVAQRIIAETVPGAYMGCDASSTFTTENGMIANDNLHYTQKADNVVGKDLASTVISKLHFPTDSMGRYESLIVILPVLMVVAILILAVKFAMFRVERD